MTSQSHMLPEDPEFAFCPAYDVETDVQQIRIVFAGMKGYVPTALVALSLHDAELLCDRLNARLGLDRDAWSALAGRSMAASPTKAAITAPCIDPGRRQFRGPDSHHAESAANGGNK